jgi:hypothetical protein
MKIPTTMTLAQHAPAIMTIPPFHLCPQQAGVQLDAAYAWLCVQRKDAPSDADVWDLRFYWAQTRPRLLQMLLAGEYRLKPIQIIKKKQGDALAVWGAQDALVLKWVALLVAPQLTLHERCEHVKGHGGGPASVQRMATAIQMCGYRWVCRTDIRGYYGHIRKGDLLAQVQKQVSQPALYGLIAQYIHYTVEEGGEFYTPDKGISRGCALSPLMGALHLTAMDEHFSKQKHIYYARYMDDIVILTQTRWQLRRQVKALNGFFNVGGFEKHPEKTFIGRTERGYDWMGAQMSDAGVEGIARRARANHVERCRRLYERVRNWPAGLRRVRMAVYRKRWKIWVSTLLALAGGGTVCGLHAQVTGYPVNAKAIIDTAGGVALEPRGPNRLGGDTGTADGLQWSWVQALIPPTYSQPNHANNMTMRVYPMYAVATGGQATIENRAWGTCVIKFTGQQDLPDWTVTLSGQTLPYDVTNPVGDVGAVRGVTIGGSNQDGKDWYVDRAPNATVSDINCNLAYALTLTTTVPSGGNTVSLMLDPRLNATGLAEIFTRGTGIAHISIAGLGHGTYATGVPIPNSQITFAGMPVCAWKNSPAGDPAYTFHDVPNAAVGAPGDIIETESTPITAAITCDWGTSTGAVADAVVSGWSATALDSDGINVSFTDDSLALQLLAPAALPAGVRWGTLQSGLGRPLSFGTSAASAKTLWTWDITSTSGAINPPPVYLTPRLVAQKSVLSGALGKKTAQVTLILVTK